MSQRRTAGSDLAQRQHQPVGEREHETPDRVAERDALVLHVQPQQAGAAQQAGDDVEQERKDLVEPWRAA